MSATATEPDPRGRRGTAPADRPAGDAAAAHNGAKQHDSKKTKGQAQPPAKGGAPENPEKTRPFLGGTRWVPRVASLLTYLAAIVFLVSALTQPERGRLNELRHVVPFAASATATTLTVITGLGLLVLAKGLRRRKRRAWRGAVVLLAAGIALHLLKGLDYEEATFSAILLVLLLVTRREFQAVSDPRTRWGAVGALFGMLVADLVLGVLLLLASRHLTGDTSVWGYIQTVFRGLVGVQGPIHVTSDRRADVVVATLASLGALTVVVPGYLALRPAEPRPLMTADDEARMRELLAKHGDRDSLGYFGLRRDKSVIWSPSGKAAIAYRVVSGVMLASGDPLGDPEAWPGAITCFLTEAQLHAWVPAVMGCSELGGQAWVRAGLDAFELGDEAIVDATAFSLDGRAMRNVRQAVNRVERAGYTAEVSRVVDIPLERREELREQAAAWRGAETERGFSMALGRFGDPCDPGCVVVTALQEGTLRAFLHFVPWGEDGLSLDLMRRDRDADNGLNEFLIVSALNGSKGLGVRRISLNFAMFRSALERGERIGAGPFLRVWRKLLLFAGRWYQIESLYKFNAKFQPTWEPRFVCYPSAGDLPRIALAAGEAEAFVVWPSLAKFVPWLRFGKPEVTVTRDCQHGSSSA